MPTTLAVPVPVPAVNVAEQLAVPRTPATSAHGEPVKLPEAVPVNVAVSVTLPVGVICVPGLLDGSVTVAVHVDVPVGEIVAGEQLTVVVVGRVLTTTLAVPLLEL